MLHACWLRGNTGSYGSMQSRVACRPMPSYGMGTNSFSGGDHVYDCTLPGFAARYLARPSGIDSRMRSQDLISDRIQRGLLARDCEPVS